MNLTKEGFIDPTATLLHSKVGEYCEVRKFSKLENSSLDDYSYVMEFCMLQNTIVKKFSNIAMQVRIGATDHPMECATMHHFIYRTEKFGMGENDHEFFERRHSRITTIGNDTWIGHGAMIKNNLTIGDGAVVGQGSVVTKDVPPYAIVVGNPARILRFRFDDDTIESLLRIRWWDWSYEKLKENLPLFRGEIKDFLKQHEVAR